MSDMPHSDNAIDLEGVGKKYRVYFEKPALVRSIFPFLSRGPGHREFWALRGINLRIKRGECIGIIGPNGAGKSTILSVLAGITEPSEGRVQINGRISALLSLGAGFHQELTGRENIYLNAAILGMKRAQVDELFDEIVAYAGIGDFIEAKLSTYSSGMNMRLGFAIAVNVPFDVFLIDELLAVGDMAFQQKCFKTMRDFTEDEEKTIVFISHDIGRIEEICSRAVWIENGTIEESDAAEVVVRKYRQRYRHKFEAFDLKIRKKPRECRARVEIAADRVIRRIPESLFGSNVDWTCEGSLIWDAEKNQAHPSLLNTLKGYRFTLLRYPGGQSADHFHWNDAVGRARKPQIDGHNRLASYPYFGPDEFISFCTTLRASPLITLNCGSGTVDEALGWARHVRERGGQPSYWELGHELYYDDYHNLGIDFPMRPEEYARKALAIGRGLRQITPDAKLLFIGCRDTGVFTRYRYPDWNRIVLETCGAEMDYLAVHNATVPIMNITPEYGVPELEDTARGLLAAPCYVAHNLDAVCGELGGRARIAITDYSVMFTDIPTVVHGAHPVNGRPEASIEWERNTYCVSALVEAMFLNLFIRRSEVDIACRFSLLSQLYSTLYRYADGRWIATPQALVHALYNRLAGHLCVHLSMEVDGYDSPACGVIPSMRGVPCLDGLAVRSARGDKLIISLVNRNIESDVQAEIMINGFEARQMTVKTMSAPQFYSRNTAQTPDNILLHERTLPVPDPSKALQVKVPKHSLMFLVLDREEWL